MCICYGRRECQFKAGGSTLVHAQQSSIVFLNATFSMVCIWMSCSYISLLIRTIPHDVNLSQIDTDFFCSAYSSTSNCWRRWQKMRLKVKKIGVGTCRRQRQNCSDWICSEMKQWTMVLLFGRAGTEKEQRLPSYEFSCARDRRVARRHLGKGRVSSFSFSTQSVCR